MKEHMFVVEDLKQQLSPLGECVISETYEYEIPPLKHLRTDIELKS